MGRGQGRIGASLVARGRTLNTVTLLVTALFFFFLKELPLTIPAVHTLPRLHRLLQSLTYSRFAPAPHRHMYCLKVVPILAM